MRERAAEEHIEHVLDRDVAGELGDAVLGPFKVADVEVMAERRVEPLRPGRADEHARYVSLGEDGDDRGQVGPHARVRDEDGHVALGRSERRPYLPLQIVVARGEEAAGEQPAAKHLRGIEVMRLRVDVDVLGVCDERGDLVDRFGVEQRAGIAKRRIVEGEHPAEHRRAVVLRGEGEVDVEVPGLSFAERLGAGDLDFELLEPFETDLLAEAMHARNGDVGVRLRAVSMRCIISISQLQCKFETGVKTYQHIVP